MFWFDLFGMINQTVLKPISAFWHRILSGSACDLLRPLYPGYRAQYGSERLANLLPDHRESGRPSVPAGCAPRPRYNWTLQNHSSSEPVLLFAKPSSVFLAWWYRLGYKLPASEGCFPTPGPCSLNVAPREACELTD